MGMLLDQLRAKIKKKQEAASSNADNSTKKFNRIPRKDITFIPSNTEPEGITEHVNNRTTELIAQCGGIDKYIEGDFSVKYVDKSSKRDYITTTEIDVEAHAAVVAPPEADWEGTTHTTTADLKPGLAADGVLFFMIIIEYTQIIEVQ